MCYFAQINYICRHSTDGPVWSFCAGADTGECRGIRQEEGLNNDVLYNCPACSGQPPKHSNARRPAVSQSSDNETPTRQSSISEPLRPVRARDDYARYIMLRDLEQRLTSGNSTDRDRRTSRLLISRGEYNVEERSPSVYRSSRSDSYYTEDDTEEAEPPTYSRYSSGGEYDVEERSPSMYKQL
ncbi:hypothetical protein MRB53_040687 [Persea americana]|nr:hypothetical protein MRB53_040687 [Persea americana]